MYHSSNLIVLVWQKEGTKLCAESKSCWWKWTSWNIILWNITAYPSQPIRFQPSVTCDQSKWREVVPLSKRCERSKLPFSASMKIFTWRYLNILWEPSFKVSWCPLFFNQLKEASCLWKSPCQKSKLNPLWICLSSFVCKTKTNNNKPV